MEKNHLKVYEVIWINLPAGNIFRTGIIAYEKKEAEQIMRMWFTNVKHWSEDMFKIQAIKIRRSKKDWYLLTQERYERQINLVYGEHK